MSVGGVYRHDDIIHEIILEINHEMNTDLSVVTFSFHLVVDFENHFVVTLHVVLIRTQTVGREVKT
jgi:hypothetical protein